MREFAAAHGFELSTEFADAVADPRVKAVVLATPHSLHVDQIVAARRRQAGVVRKPLALTLTQAGRAVAACRKAGVVLALGNNKRCFPVDDRVAARCFRRIDRRGAAHRGALLQRAFDARHRRRLARRSERIARRRPDRRRTASDRRPGEPRRTDRRGRCETVRAQAAARPARRHRAAGRLRKWRNGSARERPRRRRPTGGCMCSAPGAGPRRATRRRSPLRRMAGSRRRQPFRRWTCSPRCSNSFAESIALGTPFLVPPGEMLDVVGAFEAAITSLPSGRTVAVAGASS